MDSPGPADNGGFTYEEFTGRNIGFVSAREQRILHQSRVFIPGVGGMGGAAIASLVRAGVGSIAIADDDGFELSNLNRQLFANLDTVGRRKVEVVREALLSINPELEIEVWGREWVDHPELILPRYPLVICGMDDILAGIRLYRGARHYGATVIDAYTSPLPSVTRVRPSDPRPEERLAFPTVSLHWKDITTAHVDQCLRREIEYVLVHSSSARHLDMGVATDVIAGRRERMSFAPMVITAGNLMCFEAVATLLDRPTGTDHRGHFFNPWTGRIERPHHPIVARFLGRAARRALDGLVADSEEPPG